VIKGGEMDSLTKGWNKYVAERHVQQEIITLRKRVEELQKKNKRFLDLYQDYERSYKKAEADLATLKEIVQKFIGLRRLVNMKDNIHDVLCDDLEKGLDSLNLKPMDKMRMKREPDLIACIADLVSMFAYKLDDPPRISTGGLSVLEDAFEILGYDDPHPMPERQCQFEGCTKTATSGTPTEDGYRRVCLKHFEEINNGTH
jgi:hypothetical protein